MPLEVLLEDRAVQNNLLFECMLLVGRYELYYFDPSVRSTWNHPLNYYRGVAEMCIFVINNVLASK